MISYWVLGADGEARPASRDEWSVWIETPARQVARQDVGDGVFVSTILLGLDVGLHVGRPPALPLIWETMIFGGRADGWQRRAPTRAAALELHREAIAVATRSQMKTV